MWLVVASAIVVVAASIGMSYCLLDCARKEKMDDEQRKILQRLVAWTAQDHPMNSGGKA